MNLGNAGKHPFYHRFHAKNKSQILKKMEESFLRGHANCKNSKDLSNYNGLKRVQHGMSAKTAYLRL